MDLPDCSAAVTERNASRPVHPVRVALKETGMRLATLLPHDVRYEANGDDCRSLAKDWDDFGRVLLPLIEAMTDYAMRETGVDLSDAPAIFRDVFSDAAGDLTTKGDELDEFEHGISHDRRGYAKAVRMGVD